MGVVRLNHNHNVKRKKGKHIMEKTKYNLVFTTDNTVRVYATNDPTELLATLYRDDDYMVSDWECEHYDVDFDDPDECGKCAMCGDQCYWHDEENWDDGYKSGDRVIDEWDGETDDNAPLFKIIAKIESALAYEIKSKIITIEL